MLEARVVEGAFQGPTSIAPMINYLTSKSNDRGCARQGTVRADSCSDSVSPRRHLSDARHSVVQSALGNDAARAVVDLYGKSVLLIDNGDLKGSARQNRTTHLDVELVAGVVACYGARRLVQQTHHKQARTDDAGQPCADGGLVVDVDGVGIVCGDRHPREGQCVQDRSYVSVGGHGVASMKANFTVL